MFASPLISLPRSLSLLTVALIAAICFGAVAAQAQPSLSFERERGRMILRDLKNDLRRHYYDPNFRGINLDERFRLADERIREATSIGHIFGIIAQVSLELNDSHTYFIPPNRAALTDYGWQARMIGDECYVIMVKPDSDAAAKGLRVGDRVISVDDVDLTRENIGVFQYLYYTLRPKGGMRLVTQSPGGEPRQLDVLARIRQHSLRLDLTRINALDELVREAQSENRLNSHRFHELGNELVIWNMPAFDLEDNKVDEIMGRMRRFQTLILDLRGNAGGYVTTLQRLISHFFDRDIQVAEYRTRRPEPPLIARTRGANRIFTGKLIILVDSRSASASELFARLMQLERRGTVIGDRTAGAVMRSRFHSHHIGDDTRIFYGFSITDADLIMSDGRSLERIGVAPDELLLPSGADLAAQRDPVLVRAAELAGVRLDPHQAGMMFPIRWRN